MLRQLTLEQLNERLAHIRNSPSDRGIVKAIVIRPATDERALLDQCEFSPELGVHGDKWAAENSASQTGDGPNYDVQVTIMNARVIDCIAQHADRWPLAGDNLFVDFDLTDENLPPGQRLAIGSALMQITNVPHTGCKKFAARFGPDALRFVNSPVGKQLRLRGVYAKVIRRGIVRAGDDVKKT